MSLSIDNRIVGDDEKEYDKDNSNLGIRSDTILISTITKANFTTSLLIPNSLLKK